MVTIATVAGVGEVGLREYKKQKTRQLIADAAARLFAERGFDGVAVIEVARAAEVAEATVYNYFPTKEDLVYQHMEAYQDDLIEAVASRPAGVSILDAVAGFVLEPRGFLDVNFPDADDALVRAARIISASPSLLSREREEFTRCSDSLAELIKAEAGDSADDIGPHVIADALIGVHRALVELVRRRLVEGADRRRLAEEVRVQGRVSFDILAAGLGDVGREADNRIGR
jgi:AcrR family transcriptional regulator